MGRPKKTADDWAERIRSSKHYQGSHSQNWPRNYRLLLGPAAEAQSVEGTTSMVPEELERPTLQAAGTSCEVAYGWGVIDGILTNVYTQNPDCLVEAYDRKLADTAKLLTQVVRHDLDLMDLKSVGNLAVVDCCWAGYGAIVEVVESGKAELGEEDGGGEVVSDQYFCAKRLQPKDVLFDRAGTLLDLSDHRYVGMAFYKTISELRADDRFKLPADIEKYQGTTAFLRPRGMVSDTQGNVPTPYGTNNEENPDFKTICIWEVWDKVNGTIIYVTDDRLTEIGRSDAWPVHLQLGSRTLFPLTLMVMRPAPKGFYPIPEVDLIAPQLMQINEIERMIRRDSLTKWRKYLCPAGLLSPDAKERIVDQDAANNLITIDEMNLNQYKPGGGSGQQLDLTKLVVPMEDVSFARELPARYQMLTQEISHVLGYGPSDRGGLPSTRSAREAMMINESKNQRLIKRADSIEDFYRLFCTKHIQILQRLLEGVRRARTAPAGSQAGEFAQYEKTDIQGDFEFRVFAGSAAPKNTESRRAEEMQFFQIMAPALQAAGLPIFPLLERMAPVFNWDGIDELFRNPKQAAKEGAMALVGFQQGQVPPEGILEALAKLVQSLLSPEDLQALAKSPGLISPGGGGAPNGGMRGDPNRLGTSAGTM